MNLDELRENYREDILFIAKEYGLTNLRVFGSVARGDATENSDIDLLAHPPKGIRIKFVEAENKLRDLMNKPVQLISDRAIHHLIHDNVFAEAKPL